jgi:hypothetical protein
LSLSSCGQPGKFALPDIKCPKTTLCGHPKQKIRGKWNQSLAIHVQEGFLGSLAQASVYFKLVRETAALQWPLLQLFTILCFGLTQLPLAGLYSLALVKASAPRREA